MRRLVARVGLVVVLTVLAAILGTGGALLETRPGRDLLARLLSEQSNRLVRGSITIGRIEGNFVSWLGFDSVVVRDTAGQSLADIRRLEIRFTLANLLAQRLVFSSVRASGVRLEVIKHRGDRMNYQEILRLGETPGNGPGTLLRIDQLVIADGRLTIRTPWNADGRLTTVRQRDSALAAERARPGRQIESGSRAQDGLMMVRTIDRLAARFGVMRISTPDHLPFAATIDSLAAIVSDPAIAVRDLTGRIVQGADSLLFDLQRVVLPNTVMRGSGRIDWPRDTLLSHFDMAASRLDLVDLRWVSPQFPALRGTGRMTATSVAGSRTDYDIRDLDLADPASRIRGRLVTSLDVYRGLGFRGLDLRLANVDLEIVRPYLDTLPFWGRLTGDLRADGFFDRMTVDADWLYQDSRVPGGADNRLAFAGDLTLGGPGGIEFHDTRILRSDLDLRTVRLVSPSVRLDGRLGLTGVLDGPWRNVVYDGRLEHRDGDRPLSALTGRTRLDTRGSLLGLDAKLTVDTLSFDGIRRSFPTITMAGDVRGTVSLVGFLDTMAIRGDLAGRIGRFRFEGSTTLLPPRWSARGLVVDFERADLAALSGGTGPVTRLAGRLDLAGTIDSLVLPETEAVLRLDPGSIRELAIDSGRARLKIHDGLITLDTAAIRWEGGGAFGHGTLGWTADHAGRLEVESFALSLAPFDSLAAVLLGVARGEVTEDDLLAGRARGRVALTGSLDRWSLEGQARTDSVAWLGGRIRQGAATFTVSGGRREIAGVSIRATVDSATRNGMTFAGLGVDVDGALANLRWAGRATGGRLVTARAAGGWRARPDSIRLLTIDSLQVGLLERVWRLTRPTAVVLDSVVFADSLVLATDDGSGLIRLVGAWPGRAPGNGRILALGVALRDLYALAQRDTTGIAGSVALDARVGGTLAVPTFRGSATVTGPVIGDAKAPLIRAAFNYEDRRLQSNLTFWRTGRPVLDVDATLPLDLAFAAVARRQLPGELVIRGRADSVDLGVLEAFTPNFRRVTGSLAIDAQVGGTWDAPRLGGRVGVRDGSMFVPALRVSYGPISGAVRFTGDSLVADSISVGSGAGNLRIGGVVRLERLTHPILGLDFDAREFALIDVPDYLTLRATGEVALRGPIERPVLTGDVRATSSVLYFADLITKDIVNLEDPANADLVDTTALRAQKLGAQFQSRFLDSLSIRDLRFRVGQDVWLRSSEANVQLEGQVTVNKERRRSRRGDYRVSGQFTTPRGSYTLKLGPVYRTFAVDRGTVRYFNTPDLNADLDIAARYVVRTAFGGGDDYPVIAKVTGTLLVPKLNLTTEPGRQPIPERDLLALLITGTMSNTLLAGGNDFFNVRNTTQMLASVASTVLSSEIERALISSPNAAFDLVEIRAGLAQGNSLLATGGTVTTLSLGRQLSRRLFATVNLGGCLQRLDFNRQYLGASLEYRLNPSLKFQVAAEPVQSCLGQSNGILVRPSRYQFGADIKWDREY